MSNIGSSQSLSDNSSLRSTQDHLFVNIPEITSVAQVGDFGGAARTLKLISQAADWKGNLREQLEAGGFPRGTHWGQSGFWLADKSFLSFKPNSSDKGGVLALERYGSKVSIVIPADQALKPNPSVVVKVFRGGEEDASRSVEVPNARIEMRSGTLYVGERPWSDYSGDQDPTPWIKQVETTKPANLSLLPSRIGGKSLRWDTTDGPASVWFMQVGPNGEPKSSPIALRGEVRLDKTTGGLLLVNHYDRSIVKLETAVLRLLNP